MPAYTSGNIDDGDNTVDLPMFQVRINNITLASVTPVFDTVPISQETIDMFADAGYPIE